MIPKLDSKSVSKVIDVLIVLTMFIAIGGVGLNLYIFRIWQKDAQENRMLLCESASLYNEKYCDKIRHDLDVQR